ncbi:YD repeat-containing protein [Chaetomium sp. MPI-CAGE-AT-0009]|nr:YD repeat-containing protein [Chaetomium sp. MPI-CAGE-AT-0009]
MFPSSKNGKAGMGAGQAARRLGLGEAAHSNVNAGDASSAVAASQQANPFGTSTSDDKREPASLTKSPHNLPTVSLPSSGGSLRGMGEKFSVNPATGTSSFSVPVATSSGRGGASVQLALSYDSGSGSGPFGMGWALSTSSIRRKTDKGIPRYRDDYGDELEEDVFQITGAEDLVPVLEWDGKRFGGRQVHTRCEGGRTLRVTAYRPRIEGAFQRIWRVSDVKNGETHWEVKAPNNSTTIYGDSAACRIADPEDTRRVFEWLPSRAYDEKGNLTVFEYKAEDSDNVETDAIHEYHRSVRSRSAHRYLKSIKYGNTVSRVSPNFAASGTDWLFQVVFDYGEHDDVVPTPIECRPWTCRPDPFSSYRAGFEIRQYRLCRRLLMFHHFPDEPGVGRNCVVSVCKISYRSIGRDAATGLAATTVVESVEQEAWRRRDGGGYDRESLPPVEFTYSTAKSSETPNVLHGDSLANFPLGFDDTTYQLIDLEGQGLSGVVSKTNGALMYIPNNGEGNFGVAETLLRLPGAVFAADSGSWVDLDGDGKVELVKFDGRTPGFYGRNWDETSGWDSFRTFESLPNIPWNDRNVKFIDVTGDGVADVLVTDGELLHVYYYDRDKSSFAAVETMPAPSMERGSARLLFWDGVKALYTADMTGDGLSDIVRIRHAEVCYWPSLGYGRFGRKVAMRNSPTFDHQELFDPSLLRLADVDGSGTTDLIYLGGRTATIYHNLAGNGFSSSVIQGFPSVNRTSNVQVVDLLGKGTACLVWSSKLPSDAGRQIRYLDLMSEKPYLLVKVENNTGIETSLTYTSSSLFYARDKKAGRPWLSHLPFPVHCVEKSETVDRISGNIFTTRYAYHDGYFDGSEREFRGFGIVESWDTEHYSSLQTHERQRANIDEASHIPPLLSRAWYHTGQYRNTYCPTEHYKCQYYQAYRALKGSPLRSETYSLDGTALERIPVSVTETSYSLEQRQPLGRNKHAVFMVHTKESLEILYDRKLFRVGDGMRLDPRVQHTLSLETDFFGNPTRELAVNYGRSYDDPNPMLTEVDREKQRRAYAMLTETSYTNKIDTEAAYVLPAVAESATYEVINIMSIANSCWVPFEATRGTAAKLSSGDFDIPFENFDGPYPSPARPYRRMIKKSRSIFRRDDLSGPLPLGLIEPLMLPHKNHDLAFTDAQAQRYVSAGKLKASELSRVFGTEGAYHRFPGEDGWWSNSGDVFFSPEETSPAEELRIARDNFFIIRRSRTLWHTDAEPTETSYSYDRYNLLLQQVIDPYGNIASAGERDRDPAAPLLRRGHDYRLLTAFLRMDANRNRVEVAFDILGHVVASATRGKPEDEDGDSLEGAIVDLDGKDVTAYYKAPRIRAAGLLGKATSRSVYDLHAFRRTKHLEHPQPNWLSSITREIHESDLAEGAESRVFVGFSYVDGTGRPVQSRPEREGQDEVIHNRWLTSSWVIYNNKGAPVRSYEPFFSDTHRFQDKAIHGVSPTFVYDSLGRTVAVVYPDGTWTKVAFSPWDSQAWDRADTVLIANPAQDPDVGGFIARLGKETYLPTWYSQRCAGQLGPEEERAAKASAVHASTPSLAFFDALGRDCVIDTMGRTASRMTYSFGKAVVQEEHFDSGEKWTLKDAGGTPIRTWNGRGQVFRPVLDRSRRVRALYVRDGEAEFLVEKTVYGEERQGAEEANARGRIVETFDQSGVSRTSTYDFKGNVITATRQLVKLNKGIVDWRSEVELEAETYEEVVHNNALNKVTRTILPDGTETLYTYNDRMMPRAVSTTLTGSEEKQTVIKETTYDSKGQRTKVVQGNGVETRVSYDKLNFKVRRIVAIRRRAQNTIGTSGTLQDLQYTYDASGNITHIRDDAKQTTFFRNCRVDPSQSFRYDSLCRLVEATGREHVGQMAMAKDGRYRPDNTAHGVGEASGDHANNGKALARYLERYEYDSQGNILALHHETRSESKAWTRVYKYDEASEILPLEEKNNRLSRTRVGRCTEEYRYEGMAGVTGCMTSMPTVSALKYDYSDRMVASSTQSDGDRTGGDASESWETTRYRYDATGKRVRKITERKLPDGAVVLVKETLYIGGAFEVFRRYNGDGETTLEIHSLTIAESGRRLLLIDNRTVGTDSRSPAVLYRYQLSNHQGSGTMEVDQEANILSYEEYTPYGVSGLRAMFKQTEAPKRYRFLGKEQDDSGLYHLGARYYAAWLGRFTSADPKGAQDGLNLYQYAHDNPVMLADPGGTQAGPVSAALGWTANELGQRSGWVTKMADAVGSMTGRQLTNNMSNIFGPRAAQDFARMLQNNMAAAGQTAAASFEQAFKAVRVGDMGTEADVVFKELGHVWEHKLANAGRFFTEEGAFASKRSKWLLQKYVEKLGDQVGTAARNVAGATGELAGMRAPKLGVTVKGLAEGSEGYKAFVTALHEAKGLQGTIIEVVHEMNPALVHAREELNAAAKIVKAESKQLLLSGERVAGDLAKAGKGIKGKGVVGLVVVGIVGAGLLLSGNAEAQEAPGGSAPSPGAEPPPTAGESFQNNLNNADLAMSAGEMAIGFAAKRGLVSAAAAAGAGTAALVVSSAATGAAVGSAVADAVEKPLQSVLGDAAGAGAAAGTGVLAGAATGAVMGAVVGSVIPGVGTAVGAAVGGVAGAVGAGAKILIDRFW